MRLGVQTVSLRSITQRCDWLSTEMRARINEAKVIQYAEEIAQGACFPDPVVFLCPHTELLYVGDGFHRILAYEHNRATTIQVELRRGAYREAFLWNIEANKKQQGMPFSTGDLRKCIWTLLDDTETRKWTHARMVRTIGCSHSYLSHVVKEFEAAGGKVPDIAVSEDGSVHSRDLRKHKDKSGQLREKAVALTIAGKSRREVAEALGVHKSTVTAYVREGMKERNLIPCPHCKGSGWISNIPA